MGAAKDWRPGPHCVPFAGKQNPKEVSMPVVWPKAAQSQNRRHTRSCGRAFDDHYDLNDYENNWSASRDAKDLSSS